MACLGVWNVPRAFNEAARAGEQQVHKFDVKRQVELSRKQNIQMEFYQLARFIRNVRPTIGDEEMIRLLNIHSEAVGRQAGERQAQNSSDTEFQTFVATFRPPRYANSLTHEVVEDTEYAFQLRVTECVWASVFREAGLDGEIGHAAVCNMDYHWPTAFNPRFSMERDRTLMQGHDHCNHRYLQNA
jgi:hypothetical protein